MPQNNPAAREEPAEAKGWLADDASASLTPSHHEGACGRCAYPDTAICEATGLPHEYVDETNGAFTQEMRWVATAHPIADVYGARPRYIANIASIWNVPKTAIKISRVLPATVLVVSPNSQGRCAGSYNIVLNPRNNQPAYINNAPCYEQQLAPGDAGRFPPKVLYLTASHKRWAVADGFDDGPFHICSKESNAPTPLDVNNWATNEVYDWVTDRDIAVVVGAPGEGPEASCYLEVLTTVPQGGGKGGGVHAGALSVEPGRRDPGVPATRAIPQGFHVGQKVFVKDNTDREWARGQVAGMRGGKVFVTSETQRRDALWDGAYIYDQVRPTGPAAPKVNAKVGRRYLTQSEAGEFFTVELDAVYDEGERCRGRLVDCDNWVWTDIFVQNLVPVGSVRADLINWRRGRDEAAGAARDDLTKAPAPRRHTEDVDIAVGDSVEVRDEDDDAWLPGSVVGLHRSRGPLVSVNAWSQEMRVHHWKQIRRRKPLGGEPIPGARRALIIGVSYGVNPNNNPAVRTAKNLVKTLQDVGFDGEIRLLTDAPGPGVDGTSTTAVVQQGLAWLGRQAKPGDTYFLAFIGSAYVPTDDDDLTPARLRTSDFAGEAGITDDDLVKRFIAKLPQRTSVTCLFDTSPTTSVFSLAHRIKGQYGRLHFTTVAPAHQISNCNLTVLSLTESSFVDYATGRSFCGLLTDTFSKILADNSEPSINELILQLTVDLEDVDLFPLLQTNTVNNATGNTLMTKRFYLGTKNRYGMDIPCPPIKTIILRSSGCRAANATYDVEQYADGSTHRWVNVTDASLTIQWEESSWVVKRELGVAQTYLYRCSTREPCPDPDMGVWSAVDGPMPLPAVELVYGEQLEAGDAAPADEVFATLEREVRKGRVRYAPGTEVVSVEISPGTHNILMPDGSTVLSVPRYKLAFPEPDPMGPGDNVAVRDADDDEWLVAKVLKVLKNGQVTVRPVSENRTWNRPGGYIFKHVKRIELGSLAEGKDEYGSWYPIRITRANDDGTYEAEVDDGYEGRYWKTVYPHNIRRKGVEGAGGAAIRTALQQEVAKWGREGNAPPPPTLRHPDMQPAPSPVRAARGAQPPARTNPFTKPKTTTADRPPFEAVPGAALTKKVFPYQKNLGKADIGTLPEPSPYRKQRPPSATATPPAEKTPDQPAGDGKDGDEGTQATPDTAPLEQTPARAGDAGGEVYNINDRVQVRDKGGETWLPGTVLAFDAEGNPLVTPDIWPRAKPYRWNFIAATTPKPEPPPPGEWDDAEFPKAFTVRMPRHTRMCSMRQVRCVRITVSATRDPYSALVSLGCLQLLGSPVYPLPNPVIKEVKEYTLSEADPDHPPENAKSPSYSSWVCGMPAALVFVLEEPTVVFGYRLQAPHDQPPEQDPVAWKVEVADGANNGWVLWDEVDGAPDDPQLPEERLGWTQAARPQHHYKGDPLYESNCKYSARCHLLYSLGGVYNRRGTKGDGVRGQPVYVKSGDPSSFIYLSSNNSWMITNDEDDIGRQATVGYVRGTDTSVAPHLSKYWEFFVVRGAATTWQYDPDIFIEEHG